MRSLIRRLLLAACAAAVVLPAVAQDAAKGAPPAGFVAAAEPKADENNAQRAKTQPGNNAPFWRGVRDSGGAPGESSLPAAESGTLIQGFTQYPGSRLTNAGEAWRQVRNGWILPYGGSFMLIVLLSIVLFYWRKGTLGNETAPGGLKIERFTPFERSAHWINAIAFCVLAVSGIVMAFGKFFLLPVIGSTLFGWLTYALKTAHNFAGPLFAVSLLVVIVTFIKDNFPTAADMTWVAKGGGLLWGHEQIPSGRFNAGEKGIFWGGVFTCGLVTIGSGLVLDKLLPGIAYTRGQMQVAHMIHAVATILMMGLFMGHIYLGTIGVRGAYKAMRHGWVDEAWAHEHHSIWLADVKAGKVPAQRSKPAEAAGGAPAIQH